PQLVSGTYYLFVRVADPYYGNQLYEATKTNNTSTGLALSVSASLTAGVVGLPTPMLRATQTGTNVVLFWSTNTAVCLLQSKVSLTSTPTWSAVTNIPVIIGDQFYVTNALIGPSKYYRLSSELLRPVLR
ncbi:MAG: hypothetical protein NT154_42605, partial [Verrucomicrobia bacterium]|nr:hypothetical protein [Verrucomicrobiota bacterium]